MSGRRVLALLAALLVLPALASLALADEDAPLVQMELAETGAPYDFGMWMLDALAGEDIVVRWPGVDEAGDAEADPACVVTWSDPDTGGSWQRDMRGHLRQGGGMVYVVGSSRSERRKARNFWSFLDMELETAEGEAGFATWGRHPLTAGLPNIGAADPQTYISGPGATPLIRFGGQALAVALDMRDQGRAVIIDHAIMTSQINSSTPRVALRELLVRSVMWSMRRLDRDALPDVDPLDPGGPQVDWPRLAPLAPMVSDRAAIDIAVPDENWDLVLDVVAEAVEDADLQPEPIAEDLPEGTDRLTDESLAGVGLLVIGAAREDFSYSEALSVRRFVEGGGRLLLLGLEEAKPHPRMVALNRVLIELELAVSLGRPSGQAHFRPHEITHGLYLDTALGDQELPVDAGAQVWAWQAEPLVMVSGGVAAAALESGASRVVIMDAGLLLPGEERDTEPFVTLLQNALGWMAGE